MKRLQIIHDSQTPTNGTKSRFLSILSPIFTASQLKNDYDFKFSPEQFKNARRIAADTGLEEIRLQISRKPPNFKNLDRFAPLIEDYSIEHSRDSPYRTIVDKSDGQRRIIPVKHFPCCKSCLFRGFINENPNLKETIKYGTFRQLLPKYFKKAKKATDMCPICEEGKKLERKISKLEHFIQEQRDKGYQVDPQKEEDLRIFKRKREGYLGHLKRRKNQVSNNFFFHLSNKSHFYLQKAAFNKQWDELSPGDAQIILDR